MGNEILEVTGLRKDFAGITAIHSLSFSVLKGQLKAIIGPNGAGKTCLFNIITGEYEPSSGEVKYKGERIDGLSPNIRAKKGITRTFQTPKLFTNLTVLENIMVGRDIRGTVGMFAAMFGPRRTAKEERQAKDEAFHWLSFVGLEGRAQQPAGLLPLGAQRLLEVGRALATEPELLLLDEPAGGLNDVEKERLMEALVTVRTRGITILLVEHDMNVVMGLADEVLAMNFGEKLVEDVPAVVQRHPDVIKAYLGNDVDVENA